MLGTFQSQHRVHIESIFVLEQKQILQSGLKIIKVAAERDIIFPVVWSLCAALCFRFDSCSLCHPIMRFPG